MCLATSISCFQLKGVDAKVDSLLTIQVVIAFIALILFLFKKRVGLFFILLTTFIQAYLPFTGGGEPYSNDYFVVVIVSGIVTLLAFLFAAIQIEMTSNKLKESAPTFEEEHENNVSFVEEKQQEFIPATNENQVDIFDVRRIIRAAIVTVISTLVGFGLANIFGIEKSISLSMFTVSISTVL